MCRRERVGERKGREGKREEGWGKERGRDGRRGGRRRIEVRGVVGEALGQHDSSDHSHSKGTPRCCPSNPPYSSSPSSAT